MILSDRSIVEINGSDCEKFLQGILTNDVAQDRFFACMLTHNGRFLFDMFCFKSSGGYLIDINSGFVQDFVKKISFYKLKMDVSFRIADEFVTICDYNFWSDFKSGIISRRILAKSNEMSVIDLEQFNYARLRECVCDGFYDLKQESAIILEYGYDKLNAISYKKGCYVGQELIARTTHQGLVRKSVFCFSINSSAKKDFAVFSSDVEIGKVLYCVRDLALCLIKNDLFDGDFDKLTFVKM